MERHQLFELAAEVIGAADDARLFADDVAVGIEIERDRIQRDEHQASARRECAERRRADVRLANEVERDADITRIGERRAEFLGDRALLFIALDHEYARRAEFLREQERRHPEAAEAED